MPIENEELRKFGETAAKLAEASKLAGIQVGFVYIERQSEPKQAVLSFQAELVRALPTEGEWQHYDPVHAYRRTVPIGELEALLTDLSKGLLLVATGTELKVPLPHWHTSEHRSRQENLCTIAESSGRSVGEIANSQEIEKLNRIVASKSGYRYASLARLIMAFTGSTFSWNSAIGFMLAAPWPISSAFARKEGARLRIMVDGFSRIDTSRLIVNIESSRGDRRLESSRLRWSSAPSPSSEHSTYIAVLDEANPITAVNVFFDGIDGIAFRCEISEDRITGPEVAPRLDEAFGSPIASERTEEMRVMGLTARSFRSLRSVELNLDPSLAVVVGPNQSGKSTLLDALGLLSEAVHQNGLYDAIIRRRGGFQFLRWKGTRSDDVMLQAELQSFSGRRFRYGFGLTPVGTYDYVVSQEHLLELRNKQWIPMMESSQGKVLLDGREFNSSTSHELLISQIRHPLLENIRIALGSIAVYPYFQTGAAWADPDAVKIRAPARPEPGARLDRLGGNLAAVLFSMREERPDDWSHYLQIVRLAFPNLKDLRLPAPARGQVQLLWDTVEGQTFEAAELSDGTLHFLAVLCALFQPGNALVAIDEPEQHLHPDALMRLIGAARIMADRHPILLTTQSDALISMMDETPENIVVARRGPEGAEFVRPAPDDLRAWLREFSLSEMRRELESWSAEE